jgi:hypothetical protein
MNFKNAEGQLARWLEVLSSYNMTIKHRMNETHIAYKEYDSVRQHFGVENQDGA